MFLKKKRGGYWEIVESIRNKKTGKPQPKTIMYLGKVETIYKNLKKKKKK